MPLPDDQWVKGKCGLKGLSYMSVEVPTIMTGVGVNTEIIEDGVNGFIANTREEWVNKTLLLIDSFELRRTLGRKGRETVEKYYSKESQKNILLNELTRVLKQ